MAGNIRGITVEIGGDTTTLGKALECVNSKTKSLQSELKGVNTLLKMDPSNVTLLKQKQDLLNTAIENTKEKLDTLREAQSQVQAQFDKGEITEEQFRNFQREIVNTEQKLEGLTDQLKEFGSVGAQQVAQVGEKLKDAGGKVEDFGKKFSVISAGAGAVLAGSVAAFTELDSGYDTIITKTGATGDALEGLTQVADNIFGSMPTDMDAVGTAVGEVNTRFGLTGKALEGLSTQFLQFAEINGVDLNNSIGTVDKILEQFNMDASEAGSVLDIVTAKAQQTGISADTLMSSIQDNGATFKDMGLNVNEAVVLLAQFEANGVNVETALKGLKKSTTEYADEGLSMDEALKATIDSIKSAGSETEALAIAQEVFGTKGANEMAKAIREGRIDVEDLSASLEDYSGTVEGTFTGTLDPIDDASVAMNNLKLAGAELGGVLQTTFAPVLTALVEKIKNLVTWFSNLSPGMQKLIAIVLSVVAALGPLIIIIGKLISSVGSIMTLAPKIVTAFNGIKTAFSTLGAAFAANPIGIVVVAITALVAGLIYAYNHSEKFRDIVNAAFAKVKEVAGNVVQALVTFFTETIPNAFDSVVSFFTGLPERIRAAISNLVSVVTTVFTNAKDKIMSIAQNIYDNLPAGFQLLVQNVQRIIQGIVTVFQNVFNIAKTVVQTAISVIKAIFTGDFASIPGIVSGALRKIRGYFANIFDAVQTIVVNAIAAVINYFRGMVQTWVQIFNDLKAKVTKWWANFKETFKTKAKEIVSATVKFFSELPGKIWNAIVSAVQKVKTWGSNVKAAATTAVKNMVSSVVTTAKELPGKIWNAIKSAVDKVKTWGTNLKTAAGNAIRNMATNIVNIAKELPSKFVTIGKNIIDGIKNGIKNAVSGLYSSIKSSLSGLVTKAKEALGINSPSKVFATVVGKAIPEGIAKGVKDNTDLAEDSVDNMTDDLANQVVRLNGATINRQLSTTFTGGAVAASDNSAMLSKLDGIYERLGRLQMVTDRGALVGEIVDMVDAALADRQLLSARGV